MGTNIQTPKKYFDQFNSVEDVHNQWNGSANVTDQQVLIAVYSYEDYSGSAFILYKNNKTLYEVHDSHCSCNGLDNWEPEETTVAALAMRDYSNYGTEFNEAYKALVSSLGKMKVAYIAGPFRAKTFWGVVQNVRRAEAVALKYWKLGYAVICPHTNTANFDGAATDNIWLQGDIEILKRCDVVVAMDTWEQSSGAKEEIRIAQERGMEVIFDKVS